MAHKVDNAYVDPVVEDIHAVPVTSVKVVLHRPVDEKSNADTIAETVFSQSLGRGRNGC